MVATSWVLHCGSENRSLGTTPTDFSISLNQELEFEGRDVRCSLVNLCVPHTFPNVSDIYGNRTWTFRFKYYNTPFQRVDDGAATAARPYHFYEKTTPNTDVLVDAYDMVVSIPEGYYDKSYYDGAGSNNSNIPEVADAPFELETIGTSAVYGSVDLDSAAYTKMKTEFLAPQHLYGTSTYLQNRTYVEALQKAIAVKQASLRSEALQSPYQSIIKTLISDLLIIPVVNALHQIEFLIRANYVNRSGKGLTKGTSIHNFLSNHLYQGYSTIENPWTVDDASTTGAPTHQLFCKIQAPSRVSFTGSSVTNCLDFYNFGFNQMPATLFTDTDAQRIVSGDVFKIAGSTYTPAINDAGNFTPYGTTWSAHSILNKRTDALKALNAEAGGESEYVCCATWGVKQTRSGIEGAYSVEQGVYMYLPAELYTVSEGYQTGMVMVNGVECNRYVKSTYTAFAGANGVVKYPATDGDATKSEYISHCFTGTTCKVSPNPLPANDSLFLGLENLRISYASVLPIQLECPVSFNIEIDVFGFGNHLMFTGVSELRQVKMIKRIVGVNTFGEYIRFNEDAHDTIDYGTKINFNRVSTIKVRVLDNAGKVIQLSYFPEWFFTLVFQL